MELINLELTNLMRNSPNEIDPMLAHDLSFEDITAQSSNRHKSSNLVPTAKEILLSRTKLPFSRTKYTRFKDMCEKAYHIYSMYDRLLT